MKKTLFTCLLLLAISTASLADERTILVVESYHAEYAWDQSYLSGLNTALGDGYKIINMQMDTKRQPKSLYQHQADLAWQKYLEIKPDLVVLGDDNALKFLGPKFLETSTPVVYLGINNNPETYIPSGRNITGVLERPLFDFNISMINELVVPKPKSILVLFDHGTTSNASVVGAFQGKPRVIMDDTEVNLQMIGNWDIWQQTVRDAKNRGYDAIVIGLYHTLFDKSGNVAADEVMKWTSENTPLPLFGFWDFSVGEDKTIGGFVLSGKEQGKAAAAIAKDILKGTAPESIAPVIGKEGAFVFNRKQLDRFGITLPAKIEKATNWVQ